MIYVLKYQVEFLNLFIICSLMTMLRKLHCVRRYKFNRQEPVFLLNLLLIFPSTNPYRLIIIFLTVQIIQTTR